MLAFVLKFWKEIVFVIIIAGLTATISFKNHTITLQQNQIVELKVNLSKCNNAITEQNAHIEAARVLGELNTAAINNLESTLQKLSDEQNKKFNMVSNIPTPRTCIEAQQYLKNGLSDKW